MKKYLLFLLFSTLSFGQASNQMVTFTQAQSLGFPLNSGQSHVTSNQCMTKSDALAKYNLDASAMNSYSSNQLVPRSAWVNSVAYYSYVISENTEDETTCSVYGTPITVYSSLHSISLPMTFYTNTSLTTPYDGWGYNHYYAVENQLLTISNAGVLTAIVSCSGDTTAPSTPTGVLAVNASGYDINVSWNASSDNVGIDGYDIYDNGFFLASVAGGVTSYTHLQSCGGNHAYTVRAFDIANNYSAFSASSGTVSSSNPDLCN